jgi:hypothetical protein
MQQETLLAVISGIVAIAVALIGARVWRKDKTPAEDVDEHVSDISGILSRDPDALPAGHRTTGYWESTFRRILREELQQAIEEIRILLDR